MHIASAILFKRAWSEERYSMYKWHQYEKKKYQRSSNAEEILNPVKLVYNKSYNNPNFVPREGVLHAQTIMFIHTKWVPRHISNKLSNYNALCTS